MQPPLCASSLLLTLRLLQLEGYLEDEQAIDRGQFTEDYMRLQWQPAETSLLPVSWSGLSQEVLGPVSKYIMVGQLCLVLRITIELPILNFCRESYPSYC